jgi:uncharacterized protein (DUF2225 family)
MNMTEQIKKKNLISRIKDSKRFELPQCSSNYFLILLSRLYFSYLLSNKQGNRKKGEMKSKMNNSLKMRK